MPTSSLAREAKGPLISMHQSWTQVDILRQNSLCSSAIRSPVVGEFPPWVTASNGPYYHSNPPAFP